MPWRGEKADGRIELGNSRQHNSFYAGNIMIICFVDAALPSMSVMTLHRLTRFVRRLARKSDVVVLLTSYWLDGFNHCI